MDINKVATQLQAYGFNVKPGELKFDKWAKSGGYIINTKLNLCSYKNHKTMETGGFPLDREKVYSNHSYMKAIKENQKIEKDKYYQNAQLSALKYNKLSHNENISSPYLDKKLVQNFGCKILDSGDLVIPLRSLDVKSDGTRTSWIRSLQTIKPDGTKLLESGCEKKGSMHLIGFNKIFKDPEKYTGAILVAEGYATAASLHMSSALPTVVAIDAGNLEPVMNKLSKAYPNSEFYICADNDLKTEQKIGRNVGIEAAMACKEKYNCKVLIPDFTQIPNSHNLSDFNDLHASIGLENIKNYTKSIQSYEPTFKQAPIQEQLNKQIADPPPKFKVTATTTPNEVLDYYATINPKLIQSAKEIGWVTHKEVDRMPEHTSIRADAQDLAKTLSKITKHEVEIDSSLTKSNENQRSL